MTFAKDDLYRIDDRYNPENDLIPDAPKVTHTDKVLLDAIFALIERVEKIEAHQQETDDEI